MKALLIPADETLRAQIVDLSGELDDLVSAIDGGWLEGISGPGWSAYCDEEGKLKAFNVNVRATRLARLLGWPVGDTLSGPIVFLGPTDEEGDDTDVTNLVVGSAALLKYL